MRRKSCGVNKTSGKIQAILIDDKTIVHESTPLAVIENAAKGIYFLSGIKQHIPVYTKIYIE